MLFVCLSDPLERRCFDVYKPDYDNCEEYDEYEQCGEGYCKKCVNQWCGVENPGGNPNKCYQQHEIGWTLNEKIGRCVNTASADGKTCEVYATMSEAEEKGCFIEV